MWSVWHTQKETTRSHQNVYLSTLHRETQPRQRRQQELIERLQEIQEECPDAMVSGVFQPNYPLIGEILSITTMQDEDGVRVFIGLADGYEYGSRTHYADQFVMEGEDHWDD